MTGWTLEERDIAGDVGTEYMTSAPVRLQCFLEVHDVYRLYFLYHPSVLKMYIDLRSLRLLAISACWLCPGPAFRAPSIRLTLTTPPPTNQAEFATFKPYLLRC